MKKILFSICILLFAACDDTSDEILEEALEEVLLNEPLADIETILDKGITIDGITLDYATIYQSIDNFPVIKPNPINQFINESEILVYFELISRSREALLQYYAKIEEENLERGFVLEYALKYYDRLQDISIEVKKNNGTFNKINNNSNTIKIFPTPDIDSQYTFAKYEMTIEEFVARYKASFPDYFVFSFNDKGAKSNTYTFRITFKFNNNKQFVLNTKPINF